MDGAWSGPILVDLLGLKGPWILCLDRTTWMVGRKPVNILMLAIATRRWRAPLLWTLLDKKGNSDGAERIALLQRFVALFGVERIRVLLADREFIGEDWVDFLLKNNIPFVIRLKANRHVILDDGRHATLANLLRRKRAFKALAERHGRLKNMDPALGTPLRFVAKRLKSGELLIVMAYKIRPEKALNFYRKRWAVECLFGDMKTRGFGLEDTRMTDPNKLSTLLAIVAIALAWACRAASHLKGRSSIPTKAHGYRQKSWFRLGCDTLRRWICYPEIGNENQWAIH